MKVLAYIILFILFSCASIQAPTGGNKDTSPPVIINMIPSNYSTNFRGKRIIIEFDEYIQLNNVYEQLLISPPIDGRPEISIKGKSVIIDLNEELEGNTTYTFHLGEGIIDNNEGNVLDSNKVVFSTGNVLDSLRISGVVNMAKDGAPVSCAVLLFRTESDSAFLNDRPAYYTKSKDSGIFDFEYLAAGSYQLFAIEDLDRNYNWSEEEKMAFLEDRIYVSGKDSTVYKLRLFNKTPDSLEIKSAQAKPYGQVDIVFNKDPGEILFDAMGFEYDTIFRHEYRPDSIRIWFKNIVPQDECGLVIKGLEGWRDTIDLFAFESKKEKELPRLELLNARRILQNPKDELILLSTNPIARIDEDKVVFILDTTQYPIDFYKSSTLQYSADVNWKEASKGSIGFFPGALIDIFEQENDTIIAGIKILDESDYASLNLEVTIPYKGEFVLLSFIDDELLFSETLNKDTLFTWTWLKPGKATFILYHDLNQNRIWDSGDYFKGIQPEKAWSNLDPIQLRPNWSIDQEWIIQEE